MILWIIVAIVIIVGFIFISVSSTKSKIKLVLLVLLALFLFGTILVVYTKNKLELSTSEGFFDAVKIYAGFLVNGFQNLKTITGNALKMDWISTNGTFLNKTMVEQVKK